ncbi:MAG: nicotinate-nucleotide--dimethylbenzimidazole phosphoribosyltransferase [Bacillota bacterium]
MDLLQTTIKSIPRELDQEAMKKAGEHLDFLLKPQGSFGRMEELLISLAGITGEVKPKLEKKAVIMMCADNGVYEEGFHSYPQDITKLIAELSGNEGIVGGSVFARFAGALMVTVDVGVKDNLAGDHIIKKKVRNGTNNIVKGPAMTRLEAIQAIEIGIDTVNDLVDQGVKIIAVGEAGICNTTTSAAVLTVLLGNDAAEVVGRGSGLNDEKLIQKIKIVEQAITLNKPDKNDPLDVLAKVGGLEIAAMVGCYLAAAARGIPAVIDGFISGTAALIAIKLAPQAKKYLFPSHMSAEQGARKLLEALEMKPYLTLDMRLGEGTGALLTFNIFDCALKVMEEMGTFADLPQY